MRGTKTDVLRVTRWRGGQHPTTDLMTQNLQEDGLRVFKWSNKANYRYGVRSHGYSKSIYCIDGSIEVYAPDSRQRVTLRRGDRVDIASGVRHGITVGLQGAVCLEGTPAYRRRR